MELFITHLIFEFDLENFGLTYESLVPVVGSLKWKHRGKDEITAFTEVIMNYLLPRTKVDKEYLNYQSRVRKIVENYWAKIVEENVAIEGIKKCSCSTT